MTPLSPNSLFHFTSSIDNLLGIFENTFYPRYCYEKFDLVTVPANSPQRPYDDFCDCGIPMVCFCDIPLSQVVNHIETYGNYGLGLSKQWGIGKGLNPVVYFNKDSHFADNFDRVSCGAVWKNDPTSTAFNELMYYVKPYQGTLYRKGKAVKENVRFYDEREWRYVPPGDLLTSNGILGVLLDGQFENPELVKGAQEKLENDIFRLTFEPNDVKYVILKEESEITQMVSALRLIKGRKRYAPEVIDLLTSRIITAEQIRTDF